jgi:signal transduction histidine kinase
VSDPVAEEEVARQPRQRSVVRVAVVRFAASSVVLLLVLMLAVVILADRIARQEALRDARMRGSSIGNLIAAPLVNAKVRAHVKDASTELTTALRNRMSDGSVIHTRLWDESGTILWSDQKELVGRRFPLSDDVKKLFGTGDVTAEVSTSSKADNTGTRDQGETLEVNAGTLDADQKPMVVEASFSSSGMRADERAIIYGFLPMVMAVMLLFQVAMLPMAMSLARRVERGLAERSNWMRHALLASDLERRRIAQGLHDGVIQDLAGLSYAMPTLEAHLTDDAAGLKARETSRRVSQILSRDVAALRLMMTDIYPPDLEGPGFATAIRELAHSAGERGVQVQIFSTPDLTIPLDTARLAYRVVREGLRNIVKHSGATTAQVEVRQESDLLVVSVSDNGHGVRDIQAAEGHLGLRLLEDTVRDLDGQMKLQSSPSGGAVLEASFPVKLVGP